MEEPSEIVRHMPQGIAARKAMRTRSSVSPLSERRGVRRRDPPARHREAKRPSLALSVALAACLLEACATAIVSGPAGGNRSGGDIAAALANGDYPLDVTPSGRIKLTDGLFRQAAAPGSASMTTVRLEKPIAAGDIDGDGVRDAAALLVVDSGGSGTFTYLAAALERAGKLETLPPILLGDRITVKSLAIHRLTIEVTMLVRRPGDPMSAAASVEVRRDFRLSGGKLVGVAAGRRAAGAADLAPRG